MKHGQGLVAGIETVDVGAEFDGAVGIDPGRVIDDVQRQRLRQGHRLGLTAGEGGLDLVRGPGGIGDEQAAREIVGARNEEQLKANLPAGDLKLSDDERSRLDTVSAPVLLYPYWHQVNTASDRLGEADMALLRPFLKKDLRLG